MQCQIISIGDELLLGDTVNTNAAWLGSIFAEHGIRVTKVYTIGDDANLIRDCVTQAMEQADLVITTGGLGPTHDDITKKTIADIFGAELQVHEPTLNFIKEIFEKRNIPFSESNYGQAEVPDNCEVLFNKQGTAPGMWFEDNGAKLAVLPGIPYEMKALVEHEILPRLQKQTNGLEKSYTRHIKIAGVGESTLSDKVLGPMNKYFTDDISAAFLPSPMANTIRVSARAKSEEQAEQKSEQLVKHIYNRAGRFIIGEGKELSLSEAVGNELRNQSLTIATAESCTGGLIGNTLTDVPGSSDYVLGGIIAYANSAKVKQLAVSEESLKTYGAVSKPVALQMAKAVAQKFSSDIGISTTGIAGPSGGTEDKPVGTVWIGFWSTNRHFALKTVFTNDRLLNKERSVAVALEMVRRVILDIEPMPYGIQPQSS